MELSQYLRLIRKWAWLLVLMMVATAFATLLYGRTIGVSYQTSTILRLGQLNQNANPNNGDITVLGSLTQAYVAMVMTEPVLQATVDATGWKGGGWGDLALEVAAAPIGTQLIIITVTDHDARMAKAIADELANQLIVQSPTAGQQKKADEQRAFIQGQLTALSQEINNGQQSLDGLNAKANLETDPVKLKDLDNRISALQTKISDWQKSYTSYSDILNSSFTNYLTILQPADEGYSPPRKLATEVLIGAIAGLILATVIIFTLEFLDDRLIDVERARQVLPVPPLAALRPCQRCSQAHR